MSEPFLGEIRLASFNFAPKGWTMCNGQFLPINQNQALFSLLGTMYGGNGQTTFALPDLRSRAAIHVGPGFTQGQVVGQEFHTVTMAEMPAHNHVAQASSTTATANLAGVSPGSTKTPAQALVSLQGKNTTTGQIYGTGSPDRTMSPSTLTNVGGSQPHENRQPFAVVQYMIALQGVFPSRN